MRRRESDGGVGLGWLDVFAILSVIALLAFSLGQIARGRVKQFAMDASALAEAVSEVAEMRQGAEGTNRTTGGEGSARRSAARGSEG